jgi:hypothetical protein
LTSINISNNQIISTAGGKEAGKALGDMLKHNSALKSIDLSSNLAGDYSKSLEFVKELAAGIRDNGAMTSLNLADNRLCGINKYGNGTYDASGKWPLALPVTATVVTHVQPCNHV